MKPLFTLLYFMLIAVGISNAQELKTISRDTLGYREKFQVLKTNKKIKEGAYQLCSQQSDRLLTTGFFKNNQRDGIWKEYSYKGDVVAEGNYVNGKKAGEWSFYNDKHLLLNKFDYDKNELSYHLPLKTDSVDNSAIITGTDTLLTIAERPVIYLGGYDIMMRPLIFNLRYPAEARLKHISGKVLISFIVDDKGAVSNYQVAQGIGGGCDEEALRIVKQIPDYWVPARYKGANATAMMVVPITFNIATSLPSSR